MRTGPFFSARLLVGVAAIFTLTACANAVYPGGRSWDDGWRTGTVSKLQDKPSWTASVCGDKAKPAETFVTVYYRVSNKPKWVTVPMPLASAPKMGASVFVNLKTCEVVSAQAQAAGA